jgi:hypothetical protein
MTSYYFGDRVSATMIENLFGTLSVEQQQFAIIRAQEIIKVPGG